jgi:hypothetical protein
MPKTATRKIAKYATKCPHCGFKFIPGKDVIVVHHNIWVHEGCYEDYREKIDGELVNLMDAPPVFSNVKVPEVKQELKTEGLNTYTVTVLEENSFEIEAVNIQDAITRASMGNTVEILAIQRSN